MVSKFKEGNQLLRSGKLEEAVATYRAATEENAGFYGTYQNLGETLWKLGRLDEAIAAFRKVIELNPRSVWGLYQLGELLRQQKQFEEAVIYLRRALEMKSDVGEFYQSLGATLVELGSLDEAVGYLRQAVKLNSLLAEAYYYLGVAQSQQQHWSEAVKYYRQGLEINPGDVDGYLGLAKALSQLGKWSEAVDSYRQVLTLSESGEVLFRLGQALGQLEQWEKAIAEYQRAINLGFAGAEVRHHLGYALSKLGRDEEAVVELRQVVEENPRSAQVRHQLGYALSQLQRWREAEIELRKAVELYPRSAVVLQQLGDVLRELGDQDEAVELYQKALELTKSGNTSDLNKNWLQDRGVTLTSLTREKAGKIGQKFGVNYQGKKGSVLKSKNKKSTCLNVLFVLYGNIDSNGGYHAQLHATRLLEQGVDCLFAVPDSSDNEDVLRRSLHNLSNPVRILPYSELSIPGSRIPFANERGPDVIHAWTPRESVRKCVEKLLKQYSCSLVIHLEDNEEYLTEAKVGRPFAELAQLPEAELDRIIPGDRYHPIKGKAFLKQAQGLTMIIETLKGFNIGNVPELVLAPPVDESLFYPRPVNQDLRRSLGIPEGHIILAYTGNVHSGNRDEVRELYQAVEILNQQGCPTVLLRTGLNREEMGVESWGRSYEKYLGWVEREQVPEILAAADVLVQPGVPGMFNDQRIPSKLLEYFAMGRPVVLPKTNLGLRVKHSQEGYVLTRSDAQSIAEAVQEIKADRELAQWLSDGAIDFYLSQLEQGVVGTKLNDFYGRLTGKVSSLRDDKRLGTTFFVVTPCLNAAATIDETIKSVVSQSGDFWIRYHLQDGGSTDGTVERLQYWESVLSQGSPDVQCRGVEFSWVSTPDQGMYDAVIEGFDSFEIAPRELMTWINADDVLLPGALSAVRSIVGEHPEVEWVGGPQYVFETDVQQKVLQRGTPTPTAVIREGLCDGQHWEMLQQEGTFFSKALWFKSKHGLKGFELAGDWNLWREMAYHGVYYQYESPLGAFRKRIGQLSVERIEDYRAEIERVISLGVRRVRFEEVYRKQEWGANLIKSDGGSGRTVVEIESVREVYGRVGDIREVNLLSETEATLAPSNLVCGKYTTYPDSTGKRQAEGGLRLSGLKKSGTLKKPLVSIITVVYNNSMTLERCINSVLNQKYSNIEYIVIDGGSDIPTLDIIHKYSEKIDYFVSEPDGGIYNAMNKGLELASGDYISILNSDDWYSQDFINLCVEKSLRKGASIVHTYCRHGEEKWITPGVNEGIALGHLNISHGSFLVSRECYNKVGKYSENYRIVSDVLWIRKAFFSGAKFDLIEKFLFNFSEGGLSAGSTDKRRKLMISEIVKITQEQFEFLEEQEAEDLYLFRFEKNRIKEILLIVKKYAHKYLFINSISKYISYCFKYRNNFKLSHTESNTLFQKFITVSNKLSIPKSSIRISTKHGCFSKLVESIDAIALKKKRTKGKVILHYVFNFSTASETFIYDLIRRLEEDTIFDNFILYDNRILEKERPYEKGLHIPWADFREDLKSELYRHIFARINPDVVIAHFALNEWKLSQRIKPLGISVPTISMTHGIDVFSMRTNQEYKTYLLNDFSRREKTSFTAVSNYLKNELESHGIPKDKITLIHNTVNERFFLHRKTSNYFKKDCTLNLLAIGRLIELKGHVYLLQGLKHFIDNCYANVHLTIVYGKGTEYYDQTVAEIKKLNLTSHVSLIPFIDFSEKPDFFQSFDIFIQPSIYSNDSFNRAETFGMAVLEAIAAGLPVIVTDAGGLPEVVGYPNKFAKIVPHGNGVAIGKALQDFFEQGECFGDNSEYARERLSCFSSKKQILLLAREIIKVSQSKLNTHLFSSSTVGGAGYAAFRIHRGLLETTINSKFLTTVSNHKSFPNVKVIDNPLKDGRAWRVLQDKSISKEGLTIFTLNHPFLTATQMTSMVEDADVINLHWTARFLSIENIAQLSNMGKPLVITIRDMFPLTGGCHFFHGCSEWQRNCQNCPQLVNTFDDFPSKVLNAKRRYYNFDNITLVTLSRHSAEIVKKVPYFNKCRIEIIPNSIETDVFKPHSKYEARKKLSLPLDRKIIGYIPSSSSTVKGYRELLVAFDILKRRYKDLNPFIMLLGNKTPLDKEVKFENRSIGFINDNQTLALAYSAADLVVVPSLEETFSNTTAESISCGTPVVGFQTGGIPDMVKDGVTGYTSPVGDVEGLARGIYMTLVGKNMSQNCRAYAEKHLSFMIQARRYEELFYELYTYNTVPQLSDSQCSLYDFSETTLAVMNLLVSQLLDK